jgi:hypothetical protein
MCSQPSITAVSVARPTQPLCASLPPARAARPFGGLLARLFAPRATPPRLDAEGLSAHRLRDLGFADGRLAPPRDPLRD